MAQSIQMFEQLSSIEQARLLGKLEHQIVPAGTVIFRQYEHGDSLYILQSGRAGVYHEEHGQRQPIGEIMEGETFGEVSLLSGEPRSATIETITDCEVYVMQKPVFDELIGQHPAITRYFTHLLCHRLMQTNRAISGMRQDRELWLENELMSQPEPVQKLILQLSSLPFAPLALLEELYGQETAEGLAAAKNIMVEESGRIEVNSAYQTVLQSVASIMLPEEERNAFRQQLEERLTEADLTEDAFRYFARRNEWERACELLLAVTEQLGDMKEETVLSHDLTRVLDACPDDVLFDDSRSQVLTHYLRSKLIHNPEAGFSRLEQVVQQLPSDAARLAEWYEWMAEFSRRLGFDRKALEYMRLARHHAQMGANASALEETAAAEQQEFERLKREYRQELHSRTASRRNRWLNRSLFSKLVPVAAAIAILLFFALSDPFPGLERNGMLFVGLLLTAVLFWITDLVPDYLVSLLLCTSWVLTGIAEPSLALSGYSNSIWLFIVVVLVLGGVIGRSGILYRASLHMLKRFPKSYRGQLLGLAATGFVVNPLIPSGMTKAMLSAPMAVNVAEALGFEKRSRGMAGIVLGTFLFFVYANPFFMTAGVTNILALGLVPDYEISFASWLLYAIPGLFLFYGLSMLAVLLLLKPKTKQIKLSDTVINEQFKVLGRLGKHEKIVLVVLLAAIVLLMTQQWHGISAVWIFLVALAILVLSGVLDRSLFKQSVDISALLHIGVALSLANVAAELGVDRWLSGLLTYIVRPVSDSPYLLVLLVACLAFAISFVVTAFPAVILLMMSFLPFFLELGIEPWILIFILLLSTGPFFLPYQSEIYLATYYATEEKAFSHRQARLVAWCYALIVLVLLAASIPYWQVLGLIG